MKNLNNILAGNGQEFLKAISKVQQNMNNNINKINYHTEKEVKFETVFCYTTNSEFYLNFRISGCDEIQVQVVDENGDYVFVEQVEINELYVENGIYSFKHIYDDVNNTNKVSTVFFMKDGNPLPIKTVSIDCPLKFVMVETSEVKFIDSYTIHVPVKYQNIAHISYYVSNNSLYSTPIEEIEVVTSNVMSTIDINVNVENIVDDNTPSGSIYIVINSTDADGNELSEYTEFIA